METATTKLEVLMGSEGLARLQNAHILVLGAGGVGSNCLEALARGGIGHLALVDRDVVAPSNINRQAIAYQSTIGKRKVDVARAMIYDINPTCDVQTYDTFMLPHNIEALIDEVVAWAGGGLDYIVDAIDTVATKLALAQLAQQRNLKLISSMGGANKLHPECLRIADIHHTVNCPLARIIRKECRRRNITQLQVLYSCEKPIPATAREGAQRQERSGMGTVSYMPPIMGQMIAGEIIRYVSGLGVDDDVTLALQAHEAARLGKLDGRKKR